jgi:hypothetical protein
MLPLRRPDAHEVGYEIGCRWRRAAEPRIGWSSLRRRRALRHAHATLSRDRFMPYASYALCHPRRLILTIFRDQQISETKEAFPCFSASVRLP